MKKIAFLLLSFVTAFTACQKADLAGNTITGEGLVPFTLQAPASGTSVVLNAASPASVVTFSWSASVPGLKKVPTYKVLFGLKAAGIDSAFVAFPADNNGLATTANISYQRIDSALKANKIAVGAQTNLIWSVVADNQSIQLNASGVYNITFTRFSDGASPFVLLGPTSSLSAITTNPNSTTDFVTFNWTKSKAASGGAAITYKVVFVQRMLDANNLEIAPDFTTPLFSIPANSIGADTLLTISQKAFSDTLIANGISNLSNVAPLKWTVIATSGAWKQQATYINDLQVKRVATKYPSPSNLFIVGSATPGGWSNPVTVPSQQFTKVDDNNFTINLPLTAGNEFLLLPVNGDWSHKYALLNASNSTSGDFQPDNGNNIPAPTTTGLYRLDVSFITGKYTLTQIVIPANLFIVGSATPGGWNNPVPVPTSSQQFTKTGDYTFELTVNLSAGGEFLLLPNNGDWSHKYALLTKSSDLSGLMQADNGNNIPGPATAGMYKIAIDFVANTYTLTKQ